MSFNNPFFYCQSPNPVLSVGSVTVYSRHRAGYCSQPAAFLTNHSAPSYISLSFTHANTPIRLSLSLPPAKILATQIESPTFHYRTLDLRSTFVWTNAVASGVVNLFIWISSVRRDDFKFRFSFQLTLNLIPSGAEAIKRSPFSGIVFTRAMLAFSLLHYGAGSHRFYFQLSRVVS